MYKMSEYTFIAGLLSVGLALVAYLLSYGGVRIRTIRTATAGGPGGGTMTVATRTPGANRFATYGTLMTWLAATFILAAMVFRAVATGHGPFSNMYEFSIAFAFGILGGFLWFDRKYHQRILGVIALPIAGVLLLYATTIPSTITPLVPALQNNLLLSVHVAVAIVAYGTFSVAFAAALLYLVQPAGGRRGLPRPELLDEISYRAVVIGFPFLTLVIVLGALWAEVAWGSYWSWDPKETASLVTWLIYGAYLHARVVRGWKGNRAAWLLVAGFGATLFTYFGNLFFGGLHSYAGLNQ